MEEFPRQFGRYVLQKQLGRGAMGSVYLAHDSVMNSAVAIKLPHEAVLNRDIAIQRFYREARSAFGLRHTNLCPVYDVGEIDGRHYLVMGYIEGQLLSDYLKSAGPLSEDEAIGLAGKMAAALQIAHERGIVHRDLKPANIMLDRRGEPVVMDFGLARMVEQPDEHATQAGSVLGTPAYMSPEQARGHLDRLGPHSDVYSLGVILYEMLCGRLPFTGSTTAILSALLTEEPPDCSQFRPGLSRGLQTVCMRSLAKEPAERYQTMQELAAALNACRSAAAVSDASNPVRISSAGSADEGVSTPGPESDSLSLPSAEVSNYATVTSSLGDSNLQTHVEPASLRASTQAQADANGQNPPNGRGSWIFSGLLLSATIAAAVAAAISFDQPAPQRQEFPLPTDDDANAPAEEHPPPEPNLKSEGPIAFYELPIDADQPPSAEKPVELSLIVPPAFDDLPVDAPDPPEPAQTVAGNPTSPAVPFDAMRPRTSAEARAAQKLWAAQLKRDLTEKNGIGMELALLPPGEFLMGSLASDAEADPDEQPQFRVRLTRPFFLGRTEVSQGEWTAVMGTTPWKGMPYVRDDASCAATYISWDEALRFCEKLSLKESRTYRLPTEAEWEYACRAGTLTTWHSGGTADSLLENAWFDRNAWEIGEQYAHEVAKKQANPFGLHDMHGNVWELCQDGYEERRYAGYGDSPATDPSGPSDPGSLRVRRGGSWDMSAQMCRSANRLSITSDSRQNSLGFRIVLEVEPE